MRFYTYPVRQKIKLAEDLQKSAVEITPNDRFTYQRYLGVQEMVEGHKWQQVEDKDCYMCRRDAYALIFWSPTLARSKYLNQENQLQVDIGKIFNRQQGDEVWISVSGENNRFNRMLTLQEFVYRIEKNMKPYLRYTSEVKERQLLKQLMADSEQRDAIINDHFSTNYRRSSDQINNHSYDVNAPTDGSLNKRSSKMLQDPRRSWADLI